MLHRFGHAIFQSEGYGVVNSACLCSWLSFQPAWVRRHTPTSQAQHSGQGLHGDLLSAHIPNTDTTLKYGCDADLLEEQVIERDH